MRLSMLEIAVAIAIAALLVTLAVVLIRFNWKRRQIIRCAHAASVEQLEAIYARIEHLGTQEPTCAVLARTNRISGANVEWSVPVPAFVEPWAGRTISVEVGDDVEFRLLSSGPSEPVLRGHIYRLVPVPRQLTKSGKARNQLAPTKYVAGDPGLLGALRAISPRYPVELLAYLLASGAETFEFDSINQARVGGSPAWVQDAAFPECDKCRKRMDMILQVPGSMLAGKPMP